MYNLHQNPKYVRSRDLLPALYDSDILTLQISPKSVAQSPYITPQLDGALNLILSPKDSIHPLRKFSFANELLIFSIYFVYINLASEILVSQ